MGETVIFDVAAVPGEGEGEGEGVRSLRRLPVGEAVRVRPPDSGEVDLVLSRHAFKVVLGERHYLVDEAGHDYPLARGRNVVGRQPGNDIVVDPSYRDVSRRSVDCDPLQAPDHGRA